MKCLLVVDVQNSFADPDGTLYVKGGEDIAKAITAHIDTNDYDLVVYTRDWHIDPGKHWSANPNFVSTWPVHCEANTWGAEYHENLKIVPDAVHIIKGMRSAAYSGFEGYEVESYEADDGPAVTLYDVLKENGVTEVHVCGLATDYCVRATALDSAQKWKTTVHDDLCAYVNKVANKISVIQDFNRNSVEYE